MALSLSDKELRKEDYPRLYLIVKLLSSALSLIATLLLIDYYLPPNIQEDTILALETSTRVSGNESISFLVITTSDTITVSSNTFQALSKGAQVQFHTSGWLSIPKGISIPPNKWIDPENVYSGRGFFVKMMLTSLFALLFVRPKYWMVALLLINLIILLVVSELPTWLILGLAFGTAFFLFFYTMWTSRTQGFR